MNNDHDMVIPPEGWVKTLVAQALKEDVGSGDVSTNISVDPTTIGRGLVVSRQAGVVAALSLASWFFLFWLISGIQQTIDRLGEEARRTPVREALEVTAIGCVVLVHVLMLVIVVYSARR